MAKKNYKKSTKRKIHKKRKQHWLTKRWVLLAIFFLTFLGIGFYLKNKISFYYAMYFEKFEHKTLKNTKAENKRIHKIIENNTDKVFGFDISHYQEVKDIQWDSLSIANKSIPLQFVVLRATMGKKSKDKNFDTFWKLAQKHELIRGAYHFYRADEDPVIQANNFLESVKLEEGDLVPILDIEKNPIRKSKKELIKNLKIWLKIVEEKYGKKPILYTYYYYYRDNLQGEFNDYPLWLANYNDVPQPEPNNDWKIWQFTENGIVHGINSKVDINVFNGTLWSLKKLTID